MSEGLECSECKGMYHHTTKCSLKGVPLPVWPLHTQAEVDALLLAHAEAMVKAIMRLETHGGIEYGMTPEKDTKWISRVDVLKAIRKVGKE